MGSRYRDRAEHLVSPDGVYEELLKVRGRESKPLMAYASPEYREIKDEDVLDMEIVFHTWKVGDRFYKLSEKYYGTTEYWWIIARFNKKPTEAHLKIGETLQIPLPAWKAIQYIRM